MIRNAARPNRVVIEAAKQSRRCRRHREIDVGQVEADITDLRSLDFQRAGGTSNGAFGGVQRAARAVHARAQALHHQFGDAANDRGRAGVA